jgi:hypothetical protein
VGTNHNYFLWSFRFGAVVSGAKPQTIATTFFIRIKMLKKRGCLLNHFGAQKSYIKSRKEV